MNLLDKNDRLRIINEIEGEENKDRKERSFKQSQIYHSKIYDYVYEYLSEYNSPTSLAQIPIVSSVNLTRAVAKQEASLYRCEPERKFVGLSEEQELKIKEIYHRMCVDTKMMNANTAFKTHDQIIVNPMLVNSEIKIRVLRPHNVDAVPSEVDPEVADVYVISPYDHDWYGDSMNGTDKLRSRRNRRPKSDGSNQNIADNDDWKVNKRYVFWSDEFNFVCNGNGDIVGDAGLVNNEIEINPFIDISQEKEFVFFFDGGEDLADVTIQYNAVLSDVGHIVRMQGWSQAVLKAPSDLMPENIQIGPTHLIKLPTDNSEAGQVDFAFANPTPDLEGTHTYIDKLLSNFLTTRGHDPKLVNGKGEAKNFASGTERLLYMIEKFEASQEDMAKFRKAESELFDIIVAWINKYSNTPYLDPFYWMPKIPEGASVEVSFKKPSSILSEQEKLSLVKGELDAGLVTHLNAIMKYYEVDEEAAQEILSKIKSELKEKQKDAQNNINEEPKAPF